MRAARWSRILRTCGTAYTRNDTAVAAPSQDVRDRVATNAPTMREKETMAAVALQKRFSVEARNNASGVASISRSPARLRCKTGPAGGRANANMLVAALFPGK